MGVVGCEAFTGLCIIKQLRKLISEGVGWGQISRLIISMATNATPNGLKWLSNGLRSRLTKRATETPSGRKTLELHRGN